MAGAWNELSGTQHYIIAERLVVMWLYDSDFLVPHRDVADILLEEEMSISSFNWQYQHDSVT